MIDSIYGFMSSDEVQFDKAGLPVGTYKVMITGEEPYEKDGQIRGVVVEYEIVDGEHKGRSGKQWLLTLHPDTQTANISRQKVKRIAEATGSPVTPTSPLKGRVLTIQVDVQKKNPDYTEVKRYMPESHESTPF